MPAGVAIGQAQQAGDRARGNDLGDRGEVAPARLERR